MKKIALVILIGLILVSGCASQNQQPKIEKYTGPVEKISFSSSPGVKNSGIYIAKSKGFFQEEGLDVNISEVASAKQAFLNMLDGKGLDISALADVPIALTAMNRKDFYILAVISEGHDEKVIARKDSGINVVTDLKGKKVGLAGKGIGNHFFLSNLLIFNGLAEADVETVFMDGKSLFPALENGTLDAIAVVEPDASNAIKLLGDKAAVFPNKNIYQKTFDLTVRKDFAQNHPETLVRFLRAIDKANKFIEKNEEESQSLVNEKLKLDKKGIIAIWDENSKTLSLDQSLLLTLENEAGWAIRNNLTNATTVPNYLNYIYTDALEKVKPEAITIIR